MKSYLLLTVFILISLQGISTNPSEPHGKKVPIVVYNPFNFIKTIEDAFYGLDDYILYTDSAIYRYGYQKRYGQPADRRLRKSSSKNDEYFRETVMKNDSVFFFALIPWKVGDRNIVGIYSKGRVSFVDIEGKSYHNLEALIKEKYGDVDNFIKRYIASYEREIILWFSSNGLFTFDSVEEAASQLRNDYNFVWYYNSEDLDRVTGLYVDQILEIKPDFDRSALTDSISTHISNSKPYEFWDMLFRYAQKGRDYYTYMGGYDVTPVLKSYFNEYDYITISKGLALRRSKSLAAYRFLQNTYIEEIMEITTTGLFDDNSTLNYLRDIIK